MAEPLRDIYADLAPVRETIAPDAAALDAQLRAATGPFVVRGLAAQWPLVTAGRKSARDARDYLLRRRQDRVFTVSIAETGADGRLFYDAAMAMNFRTLRARLPDIFARMDAAESQPGAPAIYIASTDMGEYFTTLADENTVGLGARDPMESIWIGTRTRIAAHNDFPHNLAVCAVGRRRFTVFPPEQFRNLYLGPVDNTPAGRAISMVDFADPDFTAHPRFRDALHHARTVVLEPGDAIHIPSMWWHHVEALCPFNVLVNYWWRETPRWLGQPQDALNHAMMAIRDLPRQEKRIWRDLFDHYVFENDNSVTDHIPEGARSVLDPLTPQSAARIRAFLLRTLNQ